MNLICTFCPKYIHAHTELLTWSWLCPFHSPPLCCAQKICQEELWAVIGNGTLRPPTLGSTPSSPLTCRSSTAEAFRKQPFFIWPRQTASWHPSCCPPQTLLFPLMTPTRKKKLDPRLLTYAIADDIHIWEQLKLISFSINANTKDLNLWRKKITTWRKKLITSYNMVNINHIMHMTASHNTDLSGPKHQQSWG